MNFKKKYNDFIKDIEKINIAKEISCINRNLLNYNFVVSEINRIYDIIKKKYGIDYNILKNKKNKIKVIIDLKIFGLKKKMKIEYGLEFLD